MPSASQPTASTPAPGQHQHQHQRQHQHRHQRYAFRRRADQGSAGSAWPPASSRNPTALPTLPDAKNGGPGRFLPTGHGRLNGKVILIDPGHNGGNFAAASVINRLIWNGRESETCDTTGAETDAG